MARSVLIADSMPSSRITLKAALATARYDVHAVATAQEAIDCLSRTSVDLIIAETNLPDMDGPELCRQLHARFGEVAAPIVLLTDPLAAEDRIAALEAGADALMERPLERGWLLTNLRSLLRAHEAHSELLRRNETASILGFAEDSRAFEAAPRIAVVSADRLHGASFGRGLKDILRCPVQLLQPDAALALSDTPEAPEVFVLCRGTGGGDGDELELLAELRARRYSRRAAILVEYAHDRDLGARALDQGANDLIAEDVTVEERALRIDRQLRLKREADRLRESMDAGLMLAARDPLTGLFNRRYAMSHLAGLASDQSCSGREFCVLIVDVDHFKAVNDTLGHVEGDVVLVRVAELLRENIRPIDLVARIGGEEFMIVLSDTNSETAMAAAERVRTAVSNASITTRGGQTIQVTVSIGIGPSGICPTPIEPVLRRADAALYRAKNGGRNAAVLWDGVEGPDHFGDGYGHEGLSHDVY